MVILLQMIEGSFSCISIHLRCHLIILRCQSLVHNMICLQVALEHADVDLTQQPRDLQYAVSSSGSLEYFIT